MVIQIRPTNSFHNTTLLMKPAPSIRPQDGPRDLDAHQLLNARTVLQLLAAGLNPTLRSTVLVNTVRSVEKLK